MYCKQKMASFQLLSKIVELLLYFTSFLPEKCEAVFGGGRKVNLRNFNGVMLVSLCYHIKFYFHSGIMRTRCATDVAL